MTTWDKSQKNRLVLREQVVREDVEAVRELLELTGLFTKEEVVIAGELVAETVANPGSGYSFLLAEKHGFLVGYSCYGKIPATVSSWDLYWIAVHPSWQGNGIGRGLLEQTETRILRAGGQSIWIDTSGRTEYHETRVFYRRAGYREAAILEDYYAPRDPKIIFSKVLR